ncbi:MAG: serine/threonine protein kinase, partial [Gordonia amarae]
PDAAPRGTGEPQPSQATHDDALGGAAGTRDTEPANPLPQLDEGASALVTAMWLTAVVLCALGVGGIGWWVGGGLFH